MSRFPVEITQYICSKLKSYEYEKLTTEFKQLNNNPFMYKKRTIVIENQPIQQNMVSQFISQYFRNDDYELKQALSLYLHDDVNTHTIRMKIMGYKLDTDIVKYILQKFVNLQELYHDKMLDPVKFLPILRPYPNIEVFPIKIYPNVIELRYPNTHRRKMLSKISDIEKAVRHEQLIRDNANHENQYAIMYTHTSRINALTQYEMTVEEFNIAVDNIISTYFIQLLTKHAEKGFKVAQHNLGLAYMFLNEGEKGMQLIKLAAEKGNIRAMYNMASIYETGMFDVQENTKLAIKYYEMLLNELDEIQSVSNEEDENISTEKIKNKITELIQNN
jgi:hypothetical protein